MINLTETQTKQAQDLIEKYGFCTLETQKELAKAGFFEKTEVQHLIVDVDFDKQIVVGLSEDIGFYSEKCMDYLPMPQFHEVWKALPNVMIRESIYEYFLDLSNNKISYREPYNNKVLVDYAPELDEEYIMYETSVLDKNITEAACLLWLKLHKERLL